MGSVPIWRWSAVETAKAIKARQVSSQDVLGAHIERLRAVNPQINAVVVDLSETALAAARAADQAQGRGEELGPLHGVPVTLKINIDVEGQANSNGVAAFGSNIARQDSPVTANFRAAGAIILGLTNTPEFSLRAFTDNPLHGLTLNPWDRTISCGGSSGGAAASIAAGIGAIAHGNDIGGSLRCPAAFNGISTLKPTQGRIAAYNPSAATERPMMAQLMSTQGPLAREVADVRLGLEVMSRRDPRDPWWVPAPLKGPPVARPIRVALAKLPPDIETDPEVIALVRRAADYLSDAGYAVSETQTPDITVAWKLWCDLISTEIETLQVGQMREVGSPDFIQALNGLLGMAEILDGQAYMRALADRSRILREWLMFLETYPLILTPVSTRGTPAVNADLQGDQALRAFFRNDTRVVSAISVLGLPVAVTPAGLAHGNPVGVQLIGSRFREDLCLDAAAAIEARVGVLSHALWSSGR